MSLRLMDVVTSVCLAAIFVLMLAAVLSSHGCMPPEGPFEPKSTTRPAAVHCFDTVGHTRGTKPFILGGTCCCTPTKELMEKYHADGLLMEMTLEDLIRLYEERGIKTALDHTGCNNLCKWGPHVVKGGHCMVPPAPGTENFEEVRFGIKYVPVEPAEPRKPR